MRERSERDREPDPPARRERMCGMGGGCILCDPDRAMIELSRQTVWEDDLWRLSTTLDGAVPGFSYLEPKRHVPHITDLDGPEATTFGAVAPCAAISAILSAGTPTR